MNIATVGFSYMRARPLATLLNVLLLALGVGTIVLLLLTTHQLEERMQRDARGIDLAVGAKGSPMQIILSAIYHIDVPTGNISWKEAQEISRHRMVKKAIPLALGDSYRGYRIVGTTPDYVAHYGAKIAAGRMWQAPMEAVLGAEVAARTGFGVGAEFHGVHGLGDSGGHAHEDHPYRVVGVLERSGSVLDRLVLTSYQSVWVVHAEHHDIKDVTNIEQQLGDDEKEFTALLLQYSSPLAVAILPRYINNNTGMQAASPAYETARLFSLIGVGVDVLRAFALVLILSAGLSVFIALYNALNERRYDLAVMRTLGASPRRLLLLLLFEGLLLAAAGAALGLVLGHAMAEVLGHVLKAAQQIEITGFAWVMEELWVVALALATGILAALLPAWRAYRTDIAGTLARG
ncbi:MAG: ABC transporter permease [Burkholderiales bacterium]|nr:ABC transporter permease [Burkholderiales bacterium]MDP2399688.1 ABC transporter permease [Burkholderiales bacterium]